MSIHPSLSASLKNRKQRSVLTRTERIRYLKDRGLFNEQTSVFGLPKMKFLKIKIKKEKAAEKAAVVEAVTDTTQVPGEDKQQAVAKPTKATPQAKPAK